MCVCVCVREYVYECVLSVVIKREDSADVSLLCVSVYVCVCISVCQFSLGISSLSHTCVSMKECVWVMRGAASGERSSWPLVPGLSWQMSE